MGLLIKGQWYDQWYDTEKHQGEFVRSAAQFRNWVTAHGEPGPSGSGGFAAEADRYHLYVSMACPWASRTLIFRELKSLGDFIGVTRVAPDMLENGWEISGVSGSDRDAVNACDYLHQIYTLADPVYSGRVTVPVLWDKRNKTIVSNESADIIRMFNSAFDGLTRNHQDYYPSALRADIDALNERIYHAVNNGVYRCGFATTQEAYESAFDALFDMLDELEARVASQRYLFGATPTEADWRLFTTLVRFDAVYFGHFKCNRQRLVDNPNLWAYTRDLYQHPGIAATVNMAHIKRHYYASHRNINPTGIVPKGPVLDFMAPHGRAPKAN